MRGSASDGPDGRSGSGKNSTLTDHPALHMAPQPNWKPRLYKAAVLGSGASGSPRSLISLPESSELDMCRFHPTSTAKTTGRRTGIGTRLSTPRHGDRSQRL